MKGEEKQAEGKGREGKGKEGSKAFLVYIKLAFFFFYLHVCQLRGIKICVSQNLLTARMAKLLCNLLTDFLL